MMHLVLQDVPEHVDTTRGLAPGQLDFSHDFVIVEALPVRDRGGVRCRKDGDDGRFVRIACRNMGRR